MNKPLRNILFVEDDAEIAEVTMMTLQDLADFCVIHCCSGQMALDHLARIDPQLVLMDVMMPEMDGPETMRRLRQHPQGAHLPIIFMTARAQVHEQMCYREMGALGVIVKPFDPLTLGAQITTMWDGAPQP